MAWRSRLAAAAIVLSAVRPAAAQEVSVGRSLRAAVRGLGPGERVPVLVEYDAVPLGPASVTDVPALRRRARLALASLAGIAVRGDVEVRERFWVVPAALVDATAVGVDRLSRSAGVRRLVLDERLSVSLDPVASIRAAPSFTSAAMQTIGADAVWDVGATGEGVTVAIFDTGVDGANPMFASRWRGRRTAIRAAWFDPFRRASQPQDGVGHGTQVLAAAIGALPAGDTLLLADGTRIVAATDLDVVTGTAPRAEWIAARVFENFGGAPFTRRSVLLQAFQWALDPDGDPATPDAPAVINNSWGIFASSGEFDPCTDILFGAIDAAEAAGIAVVFAAGNAGPAPGSVAAPAGRDDPGLRNLAVGASSGSGASLDVASFSGRGPSPCGGGTKPEIIAPGTVPVVIGAGTRTARLTGSSARGTSFSTGEVSGALALIRQVNAGATPEQAKRFLLNTAVDLGPTGPDNDAGYGLLDVPAAISAANPSFAVAAIQLELAAAGPDSAVLVVVNRAPEAWEGGHLRVSGPRLAARTFDLPPLGAHESWTLGLALAPGAAGPSVLHAVLSSRSGLLDISRSLLLTPPDVFGGFLLADGALRAGGNDFGRLGRIAAPEGFVWQGQDRLPAGSFFVAGRGRISDGIYVEVQGQPGLKTSAPAVETDWAPSRALTDVGPSAARARFDDFEALSPVGLQVDATYTASDSGGVGALGVVASVSNRSGTRLPDLTPGMFADWDLSGGETVRWSPTLGALVAEPLTGTGPLLVLASDTSVVGSAAVPLGTPGPLGFYDPASGVLADGFAEADKLNLARGASPAGLPGSGTATDQAALLSVGPFDLAPGASALVRFWLLAAPSEAAALARLTELRAEEVVPPGVGGEFSALPPFPNPLRVGTGVMTFPFSLPAAGTGPGSELTFEIYDVAGRRILRQRLPLGAGGAPPPPTWDGRLGDGAAAAAGPYLFVFRLDGRTRTGRILILR